MSQKVLQISADEAKYIDPKQIMSLTMIDGSTIYVKGEQGEEGFVEENQENVEEACNQQVQPQEEQKPLRGVGTKIALGVAATAAAALGTAALASAATRPRPMVGGPMMGPGIGMRPVMAPPMRPVMGPPMRGPVMAPPMRGPGMMGRPMMVGGQVFRARKEQAPEEEQAYEETAEVCPYCNKLKK